MNRWTRLAAAMGGWLVFGAMAWLWEHGQAARFDLPLRAAMHGWASPALTLAMRLVSVLGSEYFLIPLAALLVWRWEKRGERRAAYLLVAGSLSAELLSELLKTLFHRPRPEVFFGLPPAVTYSFPSGHAFVPVVFFGLLAGILETGPAGRAAVVVLAALIGLSRVYLGYHYPSDVVAGWALAASWVALCAMLAGRLPASRA